MKRLLLCSVLFYLSCSLKAQTVFQPDYSSTGLLGATAWSDSSQNTNAVINSTSSTNVNLSITSSHGLGLLKNGLNIATSSNLCLLVKFDYKVESCTSSSQSALQFQIGGNDAKTSPNDTLTNTGSLSTTHEYSSVALQTSKTALTVNTRDLQGSANATNADINASSYITIRWIVNAGSTNIDYTGPDGSSNTIAAGSWDIWLGNTKATFSTQPTSRANSTSLNSFKIVDATGTNVVDINNLVISIMPNNVALPINFSSFTAQETNHTVQLKWSTSSESNSANFRVTRSSDGKNFLPIGNKIVAAGNASSIKNYTYTDAVALPGNNFYQIIEEDKDGRITKSTIVLAKPTLPHIQLYPNPVRTILNVSGASGLIEIFDITGNRVMKLENSIGGINVEALPKGIYFLKANGAFYKFIKL